MRYGTFQRFSLDPKNEGEVLELAITRAFQASSGKLNAFNAGSPLVVLLESLVYTQMEWLFWLNSVPEAMVLAYMSEVLGAGRDYGSKAEATVQITLTRPLTSTFILNAGTTIYSNQNSNISYELVNNFTIEPGLITGFALVRASEPGISFQVTANELTVIAENFAYLKEITNPALSAIGSDFESLAETAERVQALMSQTTPVSALDWLNVIEQVFPGKLAEVKNSEGVLYLYIQDYVQNLTFEAYCQTVKGLLQTIEIAPYRQALLQLRIKPEVPLDAEDCLAITKDINQYLAKSKPLQPIDLYKVVVDTKPNINLAEFDVLYYYQGIEPKLTKGIQFQPFDFVGGQLLKELFTNAYYLVNASFNAVLSPFDEAELGYLSYHPVYTNLGPGVYSVGDVVKIGLNYYLINSSGNFDPATTTNWTILSTPIAWSNSLAVVTTDFLLAPSNLPGYSHGFIPQFSYTTADSVNSNLSPITPLAKISGQSVAPGEYFYITGYDQVVYYNNLAVNYAISLPVTGVNQVDIQQKPNAAYSKLSRRSKFTIGNITADNNFIYISSVGNKTPIPTGFVVPASVQYPEPQYGTFIIENETVYEVLEAFIPNSSDTIQSLLTAGVIKKAYRKYSEFENIEPTFFTPFYFSVEFVLFDQEKDIVVSRDPILGTFTIS